MAAARGESDSIKRRPGQRHPFVAHSLPLHLFAQISISLQRAPPTDIKTVSSVLLYHTFRFHFASLLGGLSRVSFIIIKLFAFHFVKEPWYGAHFVAVSSAIRA